MRRNDFMKNEEELRMWHCCGRSIRTRFCANCGTARPPKPEPEAINRKELLSQAEEFIAHLEYVEINAGNAANTFQKKAAELTAMAEKSETDEERNTLQQEAENASFSAAGCAKRALKNAHLKKIVTQLTNLVKIHG
jgi:NMD protein affecting ribosome stability and mRNA decay